MAIAVEMKVCTNCRLEKPLEAFAKQNNSPDGLMYYCKLCNRERCSLRNRSLRLTLMDILGGRRCANPTCEVPGGAKIISCLQIEHKGNNGAEDKRRFGGSATTMYLWYLEHKETAQKFLWVLCANCNWRKKTNARE